MMTVRTIVWSLMAVVMTCCADARAQTLKVLRDINQGLMPNHGSRAGQFTPTAQKAFFTAGTAVGDELFVTDGTPAGTKLVRDIVPGPRSAQPRSLVDVGGRMFFIATGANQALWVSDGTTAGTAAVPIAHYQVQRLFPYRLGGRSGVVFVGVDSVHGRELSFSDGTTAGTRTLDLWPGSGLYGSVRILGVAGNRVYLVATDGRRSGLWCTDFSTNGTVYLGGGRLLEASSFAASGNTAYIGTQTTQVWRSDGTVAGTRLVASLQSSNGYAPTLTVTSAGLWAVVDDTGPFAGLFRLWFLPIGTTNFVRLATSESMGRIVEIPGRREVVFSGSDGSGIEPWVSDGTLAGTRRILDLFPGTEDSRPFEWTAFRNGVVFRATTLAFGEELWFTDGKAGGTRLLSDINRGMASSRPTALASDAGRTRLFFRANDGVHGDEPWMLGPTGTRMLGDLVPRPSGTLDSHPTHRMNFVTAPGRTVSVFVARGDRHGIEPWVTDGTTVGTGLLKDLVPGMADSNPGPFTRWGSRAIFAAGDTLWVTDGTSMGTFLVRDLSPGPGYRAAPREFTSLGDRVVFAAYDRGAGSELWVTDGTARGTHRFYDVIPGSDSSTPREFVRVGNRVYFSAASPNQGRELWVTDGTIGGTKVAVDLVAGPVSGDPRRLTPWRGRLVFLARPQGRVHSLFISDGTPAGTMALPLTASGTPYSPLVTTATHVFVETPTGLAVTDGTVAGTRHLNPIHARHMTRLGDSVLFAGRASNNQTELWISDGTPAGTKLLADLNGFVSSSPTAFVSSGDRHLWFRAESATGPEVWRTDGTAAGTVRVASLSAGDDFVMGLGPDRLLVRKEDALFGSEPHVLDVGAASETLGTGCGLRGAIPSMEPVDAVLGQTVTVRGGHLESGMRGVLMFGQGPAVRYGSCRYWPGSGPSIAIGPVTVQGTTWRQSLPIPLDPSMIGAQFVAQAAFVRPQPFAIELSNGVRLVAGR